MSEKSKFVIYDKIIFSRTDYYFFFFISLSILFLSIFLIWYQNFEITSLEPKEQIGEIIIKRNNVRRKAEGQISWKEIYNNYPAYKNDTLYSGDISSALIIFNNKDMLLDLDENSMVVLNFLSQKQVPQLTYKQGSLRFRKNDLQKSVIEDKNRWFIFLLDNIFSSASKLFTDIFNIDTVEKTKFEIKYNDKNYKINSDDVLIDKNEKGVVFSSLQAQPFTIITPNGVKQDIKSNEKLIVNKAEENIKIKQETQFKLKEPKDGKFIFTEKKFITIKFSWDIFRDKKPLSKEFIEIRKDNNFSDKKSSYLNQTTNNKFFSDLKKGTYYWRVGIENSKSIIEYSPSI